MLWLSVTNFYPDLFFVNLLRDNYYYRVTIILQQHIKGGLTRVSPWSGGLQQGTLWF